MKPGKNQGWPDEETIAFVWATHLYIRLFFIVGVTVVSCGCASTYSPPLRSPSFGAPAGVSKGQTEMGAAAHGRFIEPNFIRPGGGSQLALGVSDLLAFEGAYDWSNDLYISGTGAVRITWPLKKRVNLLFDTSFGAGLGRGGMLCDNKTHGYDYEGDTEVDGTGFGGLFGGLDDDEFQCPGDKRWDWRGWFSRPYGGGFIDVGIGTKLRHYVIVYERLRVQVTKGENIPVTAWYSVSSGVEFTIAKVMQIHMGFGLSAWHNRFDHPFDHLDSDYGIYNMPILFLGNNLDLFVELGVSIKIGRS